MHAIRFLILLILFVGPVSGGAHAQTEDSLFDRLRVLDQRLFAVGFNRCETEVFGELVAEDLEFYHDQSGITVSKAAFIGGIENGLCKLDYTARRELKEDSLQVFPLYNNDSLYGAIQTGEHSFYAIYEDGRNELTSTARFTHLWRLIDGEWQLSRVLSFDHSSPVE
ncbi:hypothetical protein GCM10007094_34140 [Pseudovibrio japonicus]|uniref:DUF4440 domain-containing protein n=1 Tax=Pseudovibrio japonicus TaxID=366534 RepID=A0ABQ3EN50_9HYPH|nr:nuclear transport factor 2 family protein [Pseudovibrio japonicus]GHB42106.1 hypothetical protein GCM10007094_34140 [Pseudovibrio japonicus]